MLCQTKITGNIGPCGIPTGKLNGKELAWSDNGANPVHIDGYPADDYFYQYGPLVRGHEVYEPGQSGRPDTGALEERGLHQSELPTRLFRLQGPGRRPMAAAFELFGYKGTPLPKAPPPKHADFQPLRQSGAIQPAGDNAPVPIRQPRTLQRIRRPMGQLEVSSFKWYPFSFRERRREMAAGAMAAAGIAAPPHRAIRRRRPPVAARRAAATLHARPGRLTMFPPAPAAAGCVWPRIWPREGKALSLLE